MCNPTQLRDVREPAGYPYFIQEYGLGVWNHAERLADHVA